MWVESKKLFALQHEKAIILNAEKMVCYETIIDLVYNQQEIKDALPAYDHYYTLEIINFWLIKLWISLEEDNLKDALGYYFLVREAVFECLVPDSCIYKIERCISKLL